MKVSEDRYTRDLKCIRLAHRLLRLDARTQVIMDWTGFSEERIRNLYHSYPTPIPPHRHRGPTPTRIVPFLRATFIHGESSAITGLACLLGAIPVRPVPNARRRLPSVDIGERLCQVYELYRHLVPDATLSMDQFILLAVTLAQGDDLELVYCVACRGTLLVDPLSIAPRICFACRNSETPAQISSSTSSAEGNPTEQGRGEAETNPQQDLF